MNFSRLILLACWFGAALFFGAVVAPAAFGVLRSFGLPNANEIAGSIVTRSLSVINVAGFLISLILLATLLLRRNASSRLTLIIECICLADVLLPTILEQSNKRDEALALLEKGRKATGQSFEIGLATADIQIRAQQ